MGHPVFWAPHLDERAARRSSTTTRHPMDRDTIARRYPRLLRAMQWVAILTEDEAVGAIHAHQSGAYGWSEAVCHYGGATRMIERAAAAPVRHYVAHLRRSMC